MSQPHKRFRLGPISIIFGATAVLCAIALSRGHGLLAKSFSTGYLPHGYCYLWNKQLLTLHVVSDSLIFLSYLAISCTLTWFLYRFRRQIPFGWIFVAFGTFILACGFTHAMDIIVLWIPLYWLAGEIKLVTAAASVVTAVVLPSLIPKVKDMLEHSASSRRDQYRLLGAAESSLDSLYFCDALRGTDGAIEDFVINYMNSNALDLVTIPAKEILGARMCEVFPVNRKLGLLDSYKHTVMTGEPFVGEFALEEETIKTAWLRIQAVKVGDGVAITASNITARKRQEEALQKANERLTIAADSGNIGIWEWDILTNVLTWNREMFQLYGIESDSNFTTYAAWKAAIHPNDLARTERSLSDAVHGVRPFQAEFQVIWPDMTLHHIKATGQVSCDDAGRATQMVGTNLDTTRQHLLADEAHRISKLELQLKDEFLSHVSHELRSPLAAIDSFSSIIADGLAGTTNLQQDEYLRIILKNAAQLESMIEDLLYVTQAKSGKVKLDIEPVSVPDAIYDVLLTLQGPAKDQRIRFTTNCPPQLPWAHTDPVRLRQILIILCDNAIKFTPAGGDVTIHARISKEDPRFLELGVVDTGPGIEPEKVERIFEHLYQVAGPLSDTGRAGRKGLGLGLHIAKGLVVRLGGKIWVNSTPGRGSDFCFTLRSSPEKVIKPQMPRAVSAGR